MSMFPGPLNTAALSSRLVGYLSNAQQTMGNLEQQVATGKALTLPSSNPVQVVNTMSLDATLTRAKQYSTNAQDGSAMLGMANNALTQVMNQVQQVRTLVLQAGNGTSTSTSNSALAQQVTSIKNTILNLANTSYLGNPIFAGGSGSSNAYDSNGNYLGGVNAPTRTVGAGIQLPASVVGPSAFGTTGSTQLFTVLSQIASNLSSGATSTVLGSDLTNLDTAISTLSSAAAQVGTYYTQMQSMSSQLNQTQTQLITQIQNIQNVNPAKVITQLQLQQSSYQEAMWATSKAIPPSLSTFLG